MTQPVAAQGAIADPPPVDSTEIDAGVLILQDKAMLARLTEGPLRRLHFADAPRALADVTLRTFDGRAVPLAQWRGRFLLLNVWASWCAPCRDEMPALGRLFDQVDAGRIAVVALSIDKSRVAAIRFLDELGLMRLPLFVDPDMQAIKALGITGAPTSLLIDPQGRELARSEGPVAWDSDEAVLLLNALKAKWQSGTSPAPH